MAGTANGAKVSCFFCAKKNAVLPRGSGEADSWLQRVQTPGGVMRYCFFLCLPAAIVTSGAALGLGLMLSRPVQASVGSQPPELGAETVQFASESGAMLHGWLVPGQAGAGAVILLHGVRANQLAMLQRALVLKRQGFGVLLFDFQAHGESLGRHITFGHLEGQDAASAVAFLRSRQPHERIGAIGVSLGGAACLLGPAPLDVDALVLESVFPDIGSALTDRLRARFGRIVGSVAGFVLVPLFRVQMQAVLGVSFAELRPIDSIAHVRAPLLVGSGTSDAYTTIGETQALFERAPKPKTFWPVPGATHQDREQFDPPLYWQQIRPFLTKNLRTTTHP